MQGAARMMYEIIFWSLQIRWATAQRRVRSFFTVLYIILMEAILRPYLLRGPNYDKGCQ